MVLTEQRATDGQAAQAGEHEQMDECLSRSWHADCVKPIAQLGAGQRAVLSQCAPDDGDATLGRASCYSCLRQPPGVGGKERWGHEGVQPPVVLSTNELQRPSIQPADYKASLVGQGAIDISNEQSTRTRPNCEPRAAEILRLHGEQPIANGARVARSLFAQELR
jgi:hypothetical protein